jgi:hypothetical protein
LAPAAEGFEVNDDGRGSGFHGVGAQTNRGRRRSQALAWNIGGSSLHQGMSRIETGALPAVGWSVSHRCFDQGAYPGGVGRLDFSI